MRYPPLLVGSGFAAIGVYARALPSGYQRIGSLFRRFSAPTSFLRRKFSLGVLGRASSSASFHWC